MNYMDCLNKWDKALKEAGLEFNYLIANNHNKLNPKDCLLSLHDLLNNECRIEIKEFDKRLGVDVVIDFAKRLLSKTDVLIKTIEFYRTAGGIIHFYFY